RRESGCGQTRWPRSAQSALSCSAPFERAEPGTPPGSERKLLESGAWPPESRRESASLPLTDHFVGFSLGPCDSLLADSYSTFGGTTGSLKKKELNGPASGREPRGVPANRWLREGSDYMSRSLRQAAWERRKKCKKLSETCQWNTGWYHR